MKIIKRTSFIFLIVLTFFACEETIDWELDESEARLVVEGRVTNETKRHSLTLTQSALFFDSNPPTPITNAEVTLAFDGQSMPYTHEGEGIYLSSVPFSGEVGTEYLLQINVPASSVVAGSYSASSTMMRPMTLDSLYGLYTLEEDLFGDSEDSVHEMRFYAQELEGEGDFYFYEFERNHVLLYDSIDEVSFFEDTFLDGFEFEDFLLDSFEETERGDTITLKMYAIEEQYYTFLEQVTSELEETDPFGLSSPPANVVGNISGDGLGYFYATALDSIQTILTE